MARARANNAPLERDIGAAIMQLLGYHGWVVYKTDAGEAARVGRKRGFRGTLTPGAPDLIALKGGCGVAVEVKRPGGRLRKSQEREHRRLLLAGVPTIIVHSIDEMLVWLERFESMLKGGKPCKTGQ